MSRLSDGSGPTPLTKLDFLDNSDAGTEVDCIDKSEVQLDLLDPLLRIRFSVASFTQDGYVQRTDGIDLGDDDTLTARLAVSWQPTPALSGEFSIDATRDRENGPAMQLLGIDFTDLSQLQGVVLAPPPPMAFVHNVTTAALGPG